MKKINTLALALIASSVGACFGADDWPQWRGPGGEGIWRHAPSVETLSSPGAMKQVWQRPIGPGYSGVTVAGGKVFTMDRDEDRQLERLVCLSAETGDLLWRHEWTADYQDMSYAKGPRGSATVHQGLVYVLGAVGHLRCVDAETGEAVWTKDLAADHGAKRPQWGFAASPLIYEDLVIIHAAVQPGGCYSAYDKATGEERWRSGGDDAGYATPVLFRHLGEDRMIGWTPQHVLCLSPKSGKIDWRIPYKVTMGVSIAAPLVREGIVFVSGYWEGAKAIRLGKSFGEAELIWEENDFLRGLMAQPLYRDGRGWLLDKRHGLICFDWQSGRKVWSDDNRLTPRERNPQATMTWIDGTECAAALNAEGEFVVADLSGEEYRELGRAKITGKTWAHPAYVGSRVFARDDEQIVCWKSSSRLLQK